MKASDHFKHAATHADLEFLKQKARSTNPYVINDALRIAATHGHTQCVAALLEHLNPKIMLYSGVMCAAESNHLDCLALLLPRIDANRELLNRMFFKMVKDNNLNGIKVLLSQNHFLDVANTSWMIHAVINNNIPVLKLLLSTCDPQTDNSQALRAACTHNRALQ